MFHREQRGDGLGASYNPTVETVVSMENRHANVQDDIVARLVREDHLEGLPTVYGNSLVVSEVLLMTCR